MPTALVTGGAGFIGSHLVRCLEGHGWSVRVLDNLTTGSRANLEGTRAELLVGDVREPQVVEGAAKDTQVVFHLAAMISVPESMAQPTECYRANVLGSMNVLQAARLTGARRVVLSSSCAVYGDAGAPVDESAPTSPISPYAASKLAMEQAAQMTSLAFGLSTVILRYFNVYGPRQDPGSEYAAVIPRFIQRMRSGHPPIVYGDGTQSRDFVYVGDVVRANLWVCEREEAIGRVFNIATGRGVSLLELIDVLNEVLRTDFAPIFQAPREGDIKHSRGSGEAIANVLNFRPAVELNEGLRKVLNNG